MSNGINNNGKSGNLLWKLLRKHVSAVQMAGFSLASLVGLVIVLLALQFYIDIKPVFASDDSFMRQDYLVLTKTVSSIGSLLGSNAEFSDAELDELSRQPWVRKVGRFTTPQYRIYGSLTFGNRALRTYLFYESVPDEFIDELPADWGFDPVHGKVPVIVSRDYLALYNFGFAATRNMPRVSEGMIGMIPVQLTLSGNGRSETVEGRIVGFSNRLNTIIVPEEFMQWSNERFGAGERRQPSRLIVEVSRPGDKAITEYVAAHGYEIAGDKADSGKASYLLRLMTGVIVAVGIIISLLAFFVLLLSISLLMQKNSRKLQDLLMLGYTPAAVSAPYVKMVVAANAAVLVAACVAMLVCRSLYLPVVSSLGVAGGSVAVSIIVAIVIIGAITAGSVYAIRRRVATLWHN